MEDNWKEYKIGDVAEFIGGGTPDKQEKATQTVLSQAELLCAEWT